MNDDYQKLLKDEVAKNWKNKKNILFLNGEEGCGKTASLKAAIKSLNMQVLTKKKKIKLKK